MSPLFNARLRERLHELPLKQQERQEHSLILMRDLVGEKQRVIICKQVLARAAVYLGRRSVSERQARRTSSLMISARRRVPGPAASRSAKMR